MRRAGVVKDQIEMFRVQHVSCFGDGRLTFLDLMLASLFIHRYPDTRRSHISCLTSGPSTRNSPPCVDQDHCPPPWALIHIANCAGFLVCMKTVPGPVNLQTSPSPLLMPDMIPPLATRSITYLQFQATRWPLSMMYFSPSTSWTRAGNVSTSLDLPPGGGRGGEEGNSHPS